MHAASAIVAARAEAAGIFVPRLRSGRLVNPDPTPQLGAPIWDGASPSPYGLGGKGELLPARRTLSGGSDDDSDPYDDGPIDINRVRPRKRASELPIGRFSAQASSTGDGRDYRFHE